MEREEGREVNYKNVLFYTSNSVHISAVINEKKIMYFLYKNNSHYRKWGITLFTIEKLEGGET